MMFLLVYLKFTVHWMLYIFLVQSGCPERLILLDDLPLL